MNNIIIVKLDSTYAAVYSGIWQYDYGQILRIQGGNLPKVVEVHFSLQDKGGDSITRIGTTVDGATDVPIPDSLLENGGRAQDYTIYAYIYLEDGQSGNTEYKIEMTVKTRPKPEVPGTPEEPELFREAIKAVNDAANRAEQAGVSAEAWVHGHETFPERAEDNAKFYASQAKEAVQEIPGEVRDAKKEIDRYVTEKEESLKGEAGNVFFAAFKVIRGRLKMYSDPNVDKVRFQRVGSRLKYRLNF